MRSRLGESQLRIGARLVPEGGVCDGRAERPAVTGSAIVQKSLDRLLIRAVSGVSQGRRVSTLGAGAGAENEGLYPSSAPIAAALATVAASDGPRILLTQRRAAMRDRARTRETYDIPSRSEADLQQPHTTSGRDGGEDRRHRGTARDRR